MTYYLQRNTWHACLFLLIVSPLLEANAISGTIGRETARATINFKQLAEQQIEAPIVEPEVKIPEFMPIPAELPLPFEVSETETPVLLTDLATQSLEASPATSKSFAALGDNNTAIPPDTHGAVGPNHVMTVLNTQVRIQNRSGGVLSTVSLDSFWSSVNSPNAFDPKIIYDPFARRWVFTATANARSLASAVLIGVSQSSDPTGDWHLFSIDADSETNTNLASWADFPSIGFNKDWIVVQINMFGAPLAAGSFTGSNIYVFKKADLYNNIAATHTLLQSSSLGGTQAPAITHDSTLDHIYLVNRWNSSTLRLFKISGAVGAETLTALGFPSGTPWNSAFPKAPQLGTTTLIETNDDRVHSVVYRDGQLWVAHAIALPPVSPTRTSIQWWQIDPLATGCSSTTCNPTQRGVIDDATGPQFYAFPSLAVNKNNDVLLGYSQFSTAQYASGNYAYRAFGDAADTMRDNTVLKAGEDVYEKDFGSGRVRWGDYSATSVDPRDDTALWTIQEYATDDGLFENRWGTWWGCVGPCLGQTKNDFNADGISDILWRHSTTGENFIYQMDTTGFTFTDGSIGSVSNNWLVVGIGDFNGDGRSDILWRHSTSGANYIYQMNETGFAATGGSISSMPSGWNAH